jgi:hypothetical protein
MMEAIGKVVRTSRQMRNEIGREPTPEELAIKLGMPLEKVVKVLKITREPLSLEMPIGDEEDSHLGDLIEDKDTILPIDVVIQSNLRETTTRVLASVTPREERVLRMRYGIGMNKDHTLEEVGKQFSVSRGSASARSRPRRSGSSSTRAGQGCSEASWTIDRRGRGHVCILPLSARMSCAALMQRHWFVASSCWMRSACPSERGLALDIDHQCQP